MRCSFNEDQIVNSEVVDFPMYPVLWHQVRQRPGL